MYRSRFLVIAFRVFGMRFHRNDKCQWRRDEKERKARLFFLFHSLDSICLSFRAFLRSKILEMEKSNEHLRNYTFHFLHSKDLMYFLQMMSVAVLKLKVPKVGHFFSQGRKSLGKEINKKN